MLESFLQRLRSKTYQLALAGILLSILEIKAQVISQFFPFEYFTLFWVNMVLMVQEFFPSNINNKFLTKGK